MCGSASVAKCLVITFCIVAVILGCVAIGIGVWARIDSQSLATLIGNLPKDGDESATEAVDAAEVLEWAQYIFIVVGSAIVVVSLLGCIGACLDTRGACAKGLLLIFAIAVIIVILFEIGIAGAAIFFRTKVDDVLKDFLFDSLDEYGNGLRLGTQVITIADEEIEKGWDETQITLECCGVDGYKDWEKAANFSASYTGFFCGETINNANPVVPLSCCKTTNSHRFPDDKNELYFRNITGCLADPTIESANLKGCYEEILDAMQFYFLILIIVGLSIGLLQILSVGSAFYLVCKKPHKGED